VLKVAHHGSRDGTDRRLLDRVKPSVAVISVAAYNDYGHPHAYTLAILASARAKIYRTDRDGSIIVSTDGKTLRVLPSRSSAGRAPPANADASGYYIGNRFSMKFHRPNCNSLPAPSNRVRLRSRAAAIRAGYSPCGFSRP